MQPYRRHMFQADPEIADLFVPPELKMLPPDLAELFDPADPDIEFVADSIHRVRLAGLDVQDPEVLRLAIEAGHRRADEAQDSLEVYSLDQDRREREMRRQDQLRMERIERKSKVYYARLGNRCKIGYSANVKLRIMAFMPEELLAVEPGGPARESERHEQFKELRTSGEWFRYEGALVEHVAALRAAA